MKRVLNEYDQKYKIINQIEKNLQKGRFPLSPRKTQHRTLSPNKKYKNFPLINNHAYYSPYNQNKKSKNQLKELTPYGYSQVNNFRTISFRKEEEKSQKSIILLNTQRSIKKFHRPAQNFLQTSKSKSFIENNQFLSTQTFRSENRFPAKNSRYFQEKNHKSMQKNEQKGKAFPLIPGKFPHDQFFGDFYMGLPIKPRKKDKKKDYLKFSPWTSDYAEGINQIWQEDHS